MISSVGGLRYLFNVPYGVGKAAVRPLLIKSKIYIIKTQITTYIVQQILVHTILGHILSVF